MQCFVNPPSVAAFGITEENLKKITELMKVLQQRHTEASKQTASPTSSRCILTHFEFKHPGRMGNESDPE